METEKLLAQWDVLLTKPGGAMAARDVLQERLEILHRLNELGVRNIKGLSIFDAMESTNVLMREVDSQNAV